MNTDGVDKGKRRFLLAASSVAGGIAVAGTATPFVLSMLPSQRALAAGAPVEVDISKIEPGSYVTVAWRGKPVWVTYRTQAMLEQLPKNDPLLRDPNSNESTQPDYCKNEYRSIKPQYLVHVNICTHLGCAPLLKKQVGDPSLGASWPGGFFCPCHGSRYDMSVRVFKDVPAPLNMVIPPYVYKTDSRIIIGQDNIHS
ncbi:MAG: ubiquinol-cytochrome c reductase iron-sulfur subunit [Proteobacteria bacterium]|nr:ubiquinol-cytochrome c reductase iron-sulfur subunit [Pseudomonadota bacterium]MDE3208875.1 ubiquinol-cytochrome c reductase iron-sulfur subunit [Pseudomonadota bacterium]